jgi:protoporphyrin/coproporphyrin ferrochelatase
MAGPTGVLLFNLGGPERLEDVRPFLYNLFSDPAVLRFRSTLVRKAVAWLIATTRNRKSCGYYAKIGGGSPLRRITEAQAAALRDRLAARGHDVRVYVGMRCWKPSIDEAVDRALTDGVRRLVVLPLYPQFSVTTTGSAIDRFEEVLRERNAAGLERRIVRSWFDDPAYVAAMAETIRGEMALFPNPDPAAIHLLFSAHSIPERLVTEGDPYLDETRRTVTLLNDALGNRSPWTLGFQSKVGPVKWLEPATNVVIDSLGRGGVAQVLAIPVSFVSDHIETLYEIDLLYRDIAAAAGIAHFRRAPALNDRPLFVDAMASIVERETAAFGHGGAASVAHA